jgi:uncharacterized protein YndB with AHSA1/START domain
MGDASEANAGRYAYAIHTHIAAPPETVFALLADALSWPRWSFVPLAQREREGMPPPDGLGAIRRFGTRFLGSREQVVTYEPPHHFAYVILSGIPVKGYRADVELQRTASGTALRWRARFDPSVPGTGPLLCLALRLFIYYHARHLARYAGRQAAH